MKTGAAFGLAAITVASSLTLGGAADAVPTSPKSKSEASSKADSSEFGTSMQMIFDGPQPNQYSAVGYVYQPNIMGRGGWGTTYFPTLEEAQAIGQTFQFSGFGKEGRIRVKGSDNCLSLGNSEKPTVLTFESCSVAYAQAKSQWTIDKDGSLTNKANPTLKPAGSDYSNATGAYTALRFDAAGTLKLNPGSFDYDSRYASAPIVLHGIDRAGHEKFVVPHTTRDNWLVFDNEADANKVSDDWNLPQIGQEGRITVTNIPLGHARGGLFIWTDRDPLKAATTGGAHGSLDGTKIFTVTSSGAIQHVPTGQYLTVNYDGQHMQLTKNIDEAAHLTDPRFSLTAEVVSVDKAAGTAKLKGVARPDTEIIIGDQQFHVDSQGAWSGTISGLKLEPNKVTVENWDDDAKIQETSITVDLGVTAIGDVKDVFDTDVSKRVTLSGKAEPGAEITIKDGHGTIQKTTADATSGDWETRVAAPGTGKQIFEITQNIYGQTSKPVLHSVMYGQGVKITSPEDGADFDGGDLTLRGEATMGDEIVVTEGGKELGQPKVLANNKWSLPLEDVSDRKHTYTVTQTSAGNLVTAKTVTINPGASDHEDVTAVVSFDADVTRLATVHGTGANGAEITVKNNTAVLGTTTVKNGTWSMELPASLGAGSHDLTVEQSIKGEAAGSVSVTADFGAPLDITSPIDHKVVAGETVFTGTGAPAAAVRVLAGNGTVITSTTIGSDGTWTATDTNELLPMGRFAVQVSATAKGAVTTTAVASLDHVPANYKAPSVTSPAPGNTIETTTPTITGDGTPNATIRIKNAQGATILDTRADGTGHWSTTLTTPLREGINNLTVNQIVNPGGHTDTIDYTLTVKNAALAPVTVTDPTDYKVVAGPITTTGTGTNGATVQIIAGPGQIVGTTTVKNGTWTITDTNNLLPVGRFQYKVTQTLGQQHNDAIASVDHVPGNYTKPTVTSPAPGGTTDTTTPTLNGTATPGATIRITDTTGTTIIDTRADGNGSWSKTVATALKNGINTLAVKQIVNPGGHTDIVDYTLTVKAVPFTVTTPTDYEVVAGPVTTTGTGRDGATVQVLAGGGQIVGTTIVKNGTWSITDTSNLLPYARYQYKVVQTHGQDTTTTLASIDHVPGSYTAAKVTSPSNGDEIATPTPLLTGTATPGATIRITNTHGQTIATTMANNQGHWTATTTPLPTGLNTLNLIQIINPGGHTDTTPYTLTHTK